MILPKSIRKAFFSSLSWLAYHVSSRYRRVSFKNLDFVFGDEMDHKQKDEITRYSFKNLIFNFMHLMEVKYMSKDELLSKITAVNFQVVEKANSEGRPVIYTSPHFGAWEIAGVYGGVVDKPCTAVYKKLKNPTFQDWLISSRGAFGNKSLEKSNVLKPLIKLLKNKEPTILVIDSSMNKREGIEVDFLNHKTRQTATPAYLARKYNAAIIPVVMTTDDEDNYTLTYFDEIKVNKTDNEEKDILEATQLQADWLTKLIKEQPKFWFWIHRRWKTEYPEIYRK